MLAEERGKVDKLQVEWERVRGESWVHVISRVGCLGILMTGFLHLACVLLHAKYVLFHIFV